jgi:hypothetical protein
VRGDRPPGSLPAVRDVTEPDLDQLEAEPADLRERLVERQVPERVGVSGEPDRARRIRRGREGGEGRAAGPVALARRLCLDQIRERAPHDGADYG